jgi:hypothetical protein
MVQSQMESLEEDLLSLRGNSLKREPRFEMC